VNGIDKPAFLNSKFSKSYFVLCSSEFNVCLSKLCVKTLNGCTRCFAITTLLVEIFFEHVHLRHVNTPADSLVTEPRSPGKSVKELLTKEADNSYSQLTFSIQTQVNYDVNVANSTSFRMFLVHGQVTIVFVVCVGLSVCLFVCLFVQSFSQLSLIRFQSNLDMLYVWV